ncbi:MAG: redoxin domain-containing protein [Deltaproteobacteria bacterium]|nr:redoxin domain-containing protein [Deltaproteobacteria bacterium]
MSQLVELKSLLNEQSHHNTHLVAASIDAHDESRKLVELLEKEGGGKVDFPLLEDRDHKVIDRYGLLNPKGKGWPHPATYVIDQQGVVRWKFVEVDYKIRPTNAAILEALKALP